MRAARILIGLLVLVAVLAAGVYLLRLPLAGIAVRAGMSGAGLENPRARVTALSLNRIALADIAAGPPGGEAFVIEAAEATFDLQVLLAGRRVETVRAGPGKVRLELSPDGQASLPGFSPAGGEAGGPLPFSALEIDDVVLAIDTPEGRATGAVSGDYDIAKGGSATLRIETERAGIETLAMENIAFGGSVDFSQDGSVVLNGDLTGDFISAYGSLRDVNIAIEGAGGSWKDVVAGDLAGFTGEATLELRSATAPVAEVPALANLGEGRAAFIFGAPVSVLSASGRLELALTQAGVSVSLGGAPLALAADNGAELSIEAPENGVVFERGETGGRAGFAYAVRGALVSVVGTVDAETTDEGWFVHAPIRVGEYRGEAVSIADSSAVVRLNTRPGGLAADVTTSTTVREVSIGRFNILDAPWSTSFLADVDYAAKRATVELSDERCIRLERGRFTLVQQDMAAAIRDATLCGGERALAVIDWSSDLHTDFSGTLAAADASYAMGETRFAGRPPTLEFAGVYRPAIHETAVVGAIRGGAVQMNDVFVFAAADGRFDVALDMDSFEAAARFDSLRISQSMDAPLVAPVYVAGDAWLKGKGARFTYTLKTPDGARLGAGEGVHDVATAQGNSTFVFDSIEFKKSGMQPEELAPVLKGLIGDTRGVANGSGRFAWTPSGVTSTADIEFENITFGGPTRVVTQTKGLSGNIKFENLWPVATDGVQTITVDGVDLDALQLGAGRIQFEMPGDETLRIELAEFPWFGGVLGVYKANAAFITGAASAPLRAERVDFAQVLDFLDIDGLSGEGILSGVLPLVVEDGRARIENGVLKSDGPGAIRYVGAASDAAATNEQSKIAFDLLRDLRYRSLGVTVNGPLDGRLSFQVKFEGTGEMSLNQQNVRVPVIYRINLDAALLELLNQANLSRDLDLQIERALESRGEE